MSVVIVKYNAGNISSVATALDRLGITYKISDSEQEIVSADRVIFPGVGEARSAMAYLRERGLDRILRDIKAPFLGICLGMQLMCEESEEGDSTACLGIVKAQVKRFTIPRKVPHMGWSRVSHKQHPLFAGVKQDDYFYFVHSYRVDVSADAIAVCNYEEDFSAAICKRNFVGVQFQPEKSGTTGELIIRNFLEWRSS